MCSLLVLYLLNNVPLFDIRSLVYRLRHGRSHRGMLPLRHFCPRRIPSWISNVHIWRTSGLYIYDALVICISMVHFRFYGARQVCKLLFHLFICIQHFIYISVVHINIVFMLSFDICSDVSHEIALKFIDILLIN